MIIQGKEFDKETIERIRERIQKADSMKTCLALDMIVAWRVFYLCELGRAILQVKCTGYFSDDEWRALLTVMTEKPVRKGETEPPNLGEAMYMAARLGGYKKKSKLPPGNETLWRGLQRLSDIVWAWRIFTADDASG